MASSNPLCVLRPAQQIRRFAVARPMTTVAAEQPRQDDSGAFGLDGSRRHEKDRSKERASTKSEPAMDEINTLLRHPALFDPVLAPRLPIILCHGLYGFDVRGPMFFRLHYWGDLLKILRGKVGAEVFVTSVPGTGAIKERALVLHEAISATNGIKGRQVNLVAHSMGGLDARYLLSNIRPTTYHPQSLTTISTPHRGSDFMAWCRANIGIGNEFDPSTAASYQDPSVPLPFSLKAPLLSRGDAVKEVVSVASKTLSSLPASLTASISGYLLDLLDSPAYANLTPAFLRQVFNPTTPDRPDVRYFSVAARTDKINIWHPLWLPKLVLDGAEEAREAKGIFVEPHLRGNDGLVPVDSARWGEFLGTIEGADHWEVRGSSGLTDAAASAKAMKEVSQTLPGSQRAESSKGWWTWQDLYRLIGKDVRDAKVEKPVTMAVTKRKPDDGSLTDLAAWIARHLPSVDSTTVSPASPSSSPPASSVAPASPTPSPLLSTPASPSPSTPLPLNTGARIPPVAPRKLSVSANTARMLYGSVPAKPDKFSLERMTLAICRKLHNEGF